MRLKGVLTFLLLLFCACSFAQTANDLTQSRILILLDGSSSMTLPWQSGKIKYNAAKELIMKLMDSVYTVNKDVEFSLRVFGHQYSVPENNCYDTKNEVPFLKGNKQQIGLRLDDIRPRGVTSIAYSLKQAAEKDLVDIAHNAYSIILITDGGESCGGDICEVMRMLFKYKVYFKPYIISLENIPTLKKEYECMGDYLQVTDSKDIPIAVGTIVEAFKPAIKITKTEYEHLKTIAASAPSVLKVNVPPVKIDSTPKPIPVPSWQRPPVETIDNLAIAKAHSLKITPTKTDLRKAPFISLPEIEGLLPPPENIKHVAYFSVKRIPVASPDATEMRKVMIPRLPEILPEPTLPAPENIKRIALSQIKRKDVASAKPSDMRSIRIPELPEITPEPTLPAPENIKKIAFSRVKAKDIASIDPSRLKKVSLPEMPEITPEPVLPEPEKIRAITTAASLKKVKIPSPAFTEMRTNDRVIPLPAIVVEPEPIQLPPPTKIRRVELVKVRQMGVIWVVETHALTPRRVPDLPPIKIEEAITKVQTAPATPVNTTAPTFNKTMEHTMETEDAKETTLEVYFTNGKGKYFATTPQILLLEPSTGKLMKKFYRFVDASGNPDPQKNITPGTYNLTFADKPSVVVKNVQVKKDQRNKVTVYIKPASLSFAYSEPSNAQVRSKRPVSEFIAVVVERNKTQGRIENQKCWEAIEYEPGNYHIEINTFPVEVRNVDLDFDESVIMIQQPGFAKFTHDDKFQKVRLWKRDGDRFSFFYELDLRNPKSQHLRIQPGEYQVHYPKGPGASSIDKMKPFVIKPTQDTEIILD